MNHKPLDIDAIVQKQMKELTGCSELYMIRDTVSKFIYSIKFFYPEAYEHVLQKFGLTKECVK